MINLANKGLTEFPEIPSNEIQINLDQNNITELPAKISTLVNLNRLYVRFNKIIRIAPQIGNLRNLQYLLLGNNQITSLPIEIGNLTKMLQLRLEGNKLTELPKEIGQLVNLTHLFLDNNHISSLPDEIRNLKKLVHFSVNGNSLPLPETYSQSKPHETISFILEQQNDLVSTSSLITKTAYYFTNASKKSIIEKYSSLLKLFGNDKAVDFNRVDSPDDVRDGTHVVFIIAPIDTHNDEELIFEVVERCKDLGVRFYILAQKGFIEKDFEFANLSKGDVFEKVSAKLLSQFPNQWNSFSTYEDFESLIFEALKQHKPDIRLTKLHLLNIGHFSKLEISLDRELTCLIGENGTGKSTILRALALAVIGSNHKKIEEKTKRGFLKIQEFHDNNFIYEEGKIRLEYSIDGAHFYNELSFIPNDNGNDISIIPSGDSQIVYNRYNLKSLIIGFPQARGNDSNNVDFLQNKVTQPHINDLLPLINNSDDFRLRSFSGWVTNLYFDSIKSNDTSNVNGKAGNLIQEVFHIISKITKKEMNFKTVTKVDPPEVWVTTHDSPNGVPLYLVSQGFKIVIGWIGYLLKRFIDTFPLSEPKSAFRENAILLLDEVDISMHPVWQLSFIDILREIFPNTQFVFTTHDPLVIGSLSKEQVRVILEEKGNIQVIQPEVDPKGMGVAGILTSELFGLASTLDSKTLNVLDRRNELIHKQDKEKLSSDEAIELNQIFQNLNKLGINTTDRDPLYQKFIIAIGDKQGFDKRKYSPDELREQNDIALKIVEEILNEQKKDK